MLLQFFALGRESLEWNLADSTHHPSPRTPRKAELLVASLLLFHQNSTLHQARLQQDFWSHIGHSTQARNQRLARLLSDVKKMFGDTFLEVEGQRTERQLRINPTLNYKFDVHDLQDLLTHPLANHKRILSLYRGPLLITPREDEPIWRVINKLRNELHTSVCAMLAELIRRTDGEEQLSYINRYIHLIEQMETFASTKSNGQGNRNPIYDCDKIALYALRNDWDNARILLTQATIIYRQQPPIWLEEFQTKLENQADTEEWLEWLNQKQQIKPFQAPNVVKIVDRDNDTKTITEYLQQLNTAKIICVEGMAGIGKTTLVAKISQTQFFNTQKFSDGVLWASMDEGDFGTTLITWADGLGKDLSMVTGDNRLTIFRGLLESRSVLMVLDNVDLWSTQTDVFSSLIKDLRRLFPAFTKSRLLITTRSRDIVQHLSEIAVTHQLNELPHDASVELLTSLTGSDDELLNELAERVGHHPLALELVSVHLKRGLLTPVNLLELLDMSPGDVLDHIHLLVDRLLLMLPERSRSIFPYLAVVQSVPFDQEVGVWLLQKGTSRQNSLSAKQALGDLLSMYLIGGGYQDEPLRIHPIIADIISEQFQLWELDDQLEIIEQYSEIFLSRIQRFHEGYITLIEILDDWGHIQNILASHQQYKLDNDYINWVMVMSPIWFALGQYDEALEHFKIGADLTNESYQKAGWINLQIGRIYLERSLFAESETYLKLSLEYFYEAEDAAGIADVLHYQGRMALELEDIQHGTEADWSIPEALFKQSIRTRDEHLDQSPAQILARIHTESLLVDIPYHQGEYDLVIKQAQTALDQLDNLPPSPQREILRIRFYGVLGDAEDDLGNYDTALDALGNGIKISEYIGEVAERSRLLITESIVHRRIGQYYEAIVSATKSIELLTEMQDHDLLFRCHRTRSKARIELAAYESALDDLNQAILFAELVGTNRIVHLIIERATVLKQLGQDAQACADAQMVHQQLLEEGSLEQLSHNAYESLLALLEFCTE